MKLRSNVQKFAEAMNTMAWVTKEDDLKLQRQLTRQMKIVSHAFKQYYWRGRTKLLQEKLKGCLVDLAIFSMLLENETRNRVDSDGK